MVGSYSPTHNNQLCDQNQVTSSLDPTMQPMSPMSPMDHQSSQQQQTSQQQQQQSSNQINDIQNNMVVDQLDVSMMQQQQNMVDSMNQYRRTNGSNTNDIYRNNTMSNSNSSYSMQSHPSPDPICGGASGTTVNGHDTMQMNTFGNGLIRKMKTNGEDTTMQVHAQQSTFLLSANTSDSGILNGYGMNLKQEPDVSFWLDVSVTWWWSVALFSGHICRPQHHNGDHTPNKQNLWKTFFF